MRISDWSSDVCSSDLARGRGGVLGLGHPVVLSCSCRWLGTLTQRGRAGWGCTPTPRRSKAVGGVAPTYEHTRKRPGFPGHSRVDTCGDAELVTAGQTCPPARHPPPGNRGLWVGYRTEKQQG